MNERIKELTEQSMQWIPDHRNPEWAEIRVFNKEKFAELIVKECINFVENSRIEGDESVCLVGATKCKIEQHFGVEE